MNLKEDVLLKNYSTFKIGGPAKYFCVCESLDELKEVLGWARDNDEKTFILGGGSNILFSDKGFDGAVVRIQNSKLKISNKIPNSKFQISSFVKVTEDRQVPLNSSLKKEGERGIRIVCGAGVSLSKLINFSIENGLAGLEWAAGIPGTVGGAVRGNAGAFGGEMCRIISRVKAIEIVNNKNRKGELEVKIPNSKLQNLDSPLKSSSEKWETGGFMEEKKFDNEQCQFDYRSSIFKRDIDLIVWEIEIELGKGEKDKSDEIIKDIIKKRNAKQPSEYPSAGSVFKNPVVNDELIRSFEIDKKAKSKDRKVPAGWLIEKCGLKGRKIGGAMLSEKHSNFIVNVGDATADDVVILISLIKQKVRNSFGVQLQEEIEIVI